VAVKQGRNRFDALRYGALLLATAAIYAALAKLSLALASINPSATPIWPPTGFALAITLLLGYRMWPAIFAGAFVANFLTTGTVASSAAISLGNSAESLLAVYLINRWSGGSATFETPAGVARFAAIGLLPGTAISATIGVASLALTGLAAPNTLLPVWLTWWVGDLAGGILIAPALILAVTTPLRVGGAAAVMKSAVLFAATVLIGLLAFSPLALHIGNSGPLAFLSIAPLMWAALYHNQRDTAIAALILASFAVWGTLAGSGPFSRPISTNLFLFCLLSSSACRCRAWR